MRDPGRWKRYNGIPPYRETLQYIERVIRQAGWRNNGLIYSKKRATVSMTHA